MTIPVSLQEYARLVCRINSEIKSHLHRSFGAMDNVDIAYGVDGIRHDDIFKVFTPDCRISIASANIPFDLDPVYDVVLAHNRVVLTARGMRRNEQDERFVPDDRFGDAGMLILNLPSLDADDIVAGTQVIIDEITSHLSKQLEMC